MKTIRLFAKMADSAMKPGSFCDESCFDILVGGEDTVVLGPFDRPLGILLVNRVPEDLRSRVLPSLRKASLEYGALTNRGTATGVKATREIKLDGSESKTSRVDPKDPILSGATGAVVGFMDGHDARYPYCRQTVFNRDEAAHFEWMTEYAQLGADLLRQYLPERAKAQLEAASITKKDWLIPGTPFSTLTINRNWRTALHKDAGDYAPGMGVMGVLSNNRYTGGYLCFPQWRVAFDIRDGDFILDDVHEFYCNTEFVKEDEGTERISCVMYLREGMMECGTPEEEHEKEKIRSKEER